MEKVIGIGGYFFRAKDPKALAQWYEANLGVCVYPATDAGRPEQQAMVNTDPEGNRFELWQPSADLHGGS